MSYSRGVRDVKKKRIVLIMGVLSFIVGGSFLFANRDKVYNIEKEKE